MEGVALKPKRTAVSVSVIGLALAAAGGLLVPALGVVFALLVPVLGCALVGHKQEYTAWVAGGAVAAGALLAQYDALYAIALLLPAWGPLLFVKRVPIQKRVGPKGIACTVAITMTGTIAVIAAASEWLGSPLWQALTQMMVRMVQSSDQAGLLLYRLARHGFVTLPDGSADILLRVFEPVVVNQMLLSFELTVSHLLRQQLPALVLQGGVLSGLFAQLRLERMNGVMLVVEISKDNPTQRKTRVATPPGFGMLTLPRSMFLFAALLLLACVVLFSEQSAFAFTLGCTLFGAFVTLMMLQGAAMITGICVKRWPELQLAVGLSVGIVYAFLPMLMVYAGIFDAIFHFRTRGVRRADDER